MGAIVMLGRAELRHRWRSVIVLTILVGFVGAVVLALVAGARRTDTSLQRFETQSRVSDVEVNVGDASDAEIARFRRAPGVEALAQLYQVTLVSPGDRFLAVAAQVDDAFGSDVDRARLVEGRAANLRRADETTIGESLAEQLGVGVGDRLNFESYSPADIAAIRENNNVVPPAHGPKVSLRIVGIVRRPLDLGGRGAAGGVVVLTPAFYERYRDQIGTFAGSLLRVRTRPGADVGAVTAEARRLFRDSPEFSFENLAIEGQGAQNAIDVTTVGLYLAAAVAALTGLVGIGIALSREVSLVDRDQLTLSALGVRPRQRTTAAATIGIPVAVAGAALAFVGAWLASGLFPIGVAAEAEPTPGVRFDGIALAVGACGVLLAVLGIAALAATRSVRVATRPRDSARPGVAARALAGLGAPPTVAAGTHFALDRGRYRHPLPVRSSLLGASFGIVVVVAVLVFSASLDHLVTTPSAYGWTWDLIGGDLKAVAHGDDCAPVTTRLTRVPELSAVATICNSGVEIGGHPLLGWGFRSLRGHIAPKAVRGRPPANATEVALGADTLARAHRDIGDHVLISGVDRTRRYRIVGQAVLPILSDPQPLADGAVFTARGLGDLGDSSGGWNLVVRLAPGLTRAEAVRRLRPISGSTGSVITPTVPTEIDRVQRIDGLPTALAVFVAAVALMAVGFALVTAVRRRRRELAVLKTLGFARPQVRATIAWQASTVAAVGLVVGIPLGLVTGRVVWLAVADELGVSPDPTWPVLGVLFLVPAAFLAVNVIAALPARRAANTRPAAVLRSE